MLEFLKKNGAGVRLFLLVFLSLYLELALIRFTAAEVLYLGYFSNFILISVFLGIGIGFLLVDKKFTLFDHLPQVLLLLLAFVMLTRIDVTQLRESSGQLFFGFAGGKVRLPLAACLVLIFGLSALVFAGIAQQTGRCFRHYRPLVAYSIDIGGSIAGIVAFTTHSYLGGTPMQWFVVAAFFAVALSQRQLLFNALLMGGGLVLLVWLAAPSVFWTRWSPYQRIDVEQNNAQSYTLRANGIGHQTMVPVGQKEPVYDFPYREVRQMRGGQNYRNLLVIGAGSGSDVSYALHYGVAEIDAVEIDPVILRAGRKFHPTKPYDDPRVRTYVTDGRAFMERAAGTYDLIVYALPDSLASYSNLANIRLESFLFTEESFRQASRLLADDGVMVLYNYYRKSWLVDKLAGMLRGVFGHDPVVHCYNEEDGGRLCAMAIGPTIKGDAVARPEYPPATDDWPFLYMQQPKLPTLYLWIMGLFVFAGAAGVVATGQATRRNLRSNGPFLLMGAAFLLLETKSIIQFSLLFGATWLVNSLVFAAILVSVLLANLIVSRTRLRSPLVPFALLLASLVVHIALPLGVLLGIESFPLRYTVASLVLFSPIFFANLVFGCLFRDTPKSDAAFGWNLVGTMIGASLEYTSLAVGYRALGIVVAVLYLLTAIWSWRILRTPGTPAPETPAPETPTPETAPKPDEAAPSET